MKKFIQRKSLSIWMAVSLFFIYLGMDQAWTAFRHHGNGLVAYEDKDVERVSESEYKSYHYSGACVFWLLGGTLLWGTIKEWRKTDRLEKMWVRMVANPDKTKSIPLNQDFNTEEFRKWIKKNHPHFDFEKPPESSN